MKTSEHKNLNIEENLRNRNKGNQHTVDTVRSVVFLVLLSDFYITYWAIFSYDCQCLHYFM